MIEYADNHALVWSKDKTQFYRVGKGLFGCAVELYLVDKGLANKVKANSVKIAKTLPDGISLAKKLLGEHQPIQP